MQSAKVPPPRPPAPTNPLHRWFGRAGDFFFGDDVFISYSRRDASDYALALAAELTRHDFSCFLDQWGTEPNHELPESLKRTLSRSGALVVIASPGAAASRFVGEEIAYFRQLQRPILPISVDGAETGASWYGEVAGLAFTYDTAAELAAGRPGDDVLTRIRAAIEYRKRSARLRRTFRRVAAGTAALLVLAATGLAWASWRAAQEGRRANSLSHSNTATERMQVGDVFGALQLALRGVAVQESPPSLRALSNVLFAQPRLARAFRPHGVKTVYAMAADYGGTRLATHADDGLVRLWRLGPDEAPVLLRQEQIGNDGTFLAFSPGGEWLATGTRRGTLLVWDTRQVRQLVAADIGSPIDEVAFRRDGVLATRHAGAIAFWHITPGQPLRRIGFIQRDSTDALRSMTFSPADGTLALATSTRIFFTDPAGTELRDSVDAKFGDFGLLAYSPDGETLAASGAEGAVAVVPARRGRRTPLPATVFANGAIQRGFPRFGGAELFTSTDSVVLRWRTLPGRATEPQHDTIGSFTSHLTAMAPVPGRGWVATAHFNGTVAFWTVDGGPALTRDLPADAAIDAVDAAGARALLRSPGGLALWKDGGRPLPIMPSPALAVALNPQGTLAAAAWGDTLKLWEVGGPAPVARPVVRTGVALPSQVRFSPDGRVVVVAGDSGRVFALNTAGPPGARRLSGMVRVLAVGQDGRMVAGTDASGRLVIGEPGGRAPPRPLSARGADADAAAAVFTRGGRELLSYHQDGAIVRWSLAGRRREPTVLDTLMTASIIYPDEPVADAYFSADGRRLAVGFWGQLPVLWDVEGGATVATSVGGTEYRLDVNLPGDGSRLVTYFVGAPDVPEAMAVRITDASPRAWERLACDILWIPAAGSAGVAAEVARLCARVRPRPRSSAR